MMVTDMIKHYGEVSLAFNPDGIAWQFAAAARNLFRQEELMEEAAPVLGD